MEFDFLEPISEQLVAFRASLSAQQLGSKIAVHTDKEFPDLENCKIALVGVLEKRDENGLVQNFDFSFCNYRPSPTGFFDQNTFGFPIVKHLVDVFLNFIFN